MPKGKKKRSASSWMPSSPTIDGTPQRSNSESGGKSGTSSDPADPASGSNPAREFKWDNVTFKVGHRFFRVARQELVKESPVFESMFSLPLGDGPENVEGQTEENPINLDGYKPEDFEALLRLLYPTFDDFAKGSIDLTKSQWIGVSKLSTMWEMEKIRKHAIHALSNGPFNLTPIEKITLAREHSDGRWLEEGLTTLVTGDLGIPFDDLEVGVGLRTAFRIVGIRAKKAAHQHTLRPVVVAGTSYPTVSLGRFVCPSCDGSVFRSPFPCDSCGQGVPSLEEGHVIILPSTDPELRLWSDSSRVYLSINVTRLKHTACRKPLVGSSVMRGPCRCGDSLVERTCVILPLGSSGTSTTEIEMIRSTFADELKELGHYSV